MPENVGTNDLIRKVLAVSNANTPVFLILVPLGIFFFVVVFHLPERKRKHFTLLPLNFTGNSP